MPNQTYSVNDLKFHLAGGKPVNYFTNQGVEFVTARKQFQLGMPWFRESIPLITWPCCLPNRKCMEEHLIKNEILPLIHKDLQSKLKGESTCSILAEVTLASFQVHKDDTH